MSAINFVPSRIVADTSVWRSTAQFPFSNSARAVPWSTPAIAKIAAQADLNPPNCLFMMKIPRWCFRRYPSSNCCRLTTTRTPFNVAVISRPHRLMLAPIGFVVAWVSQRSPDGHDQALDAPESRTGRPLDLRGDQVTRCRCSLWNHIEPSRRSDELTHTATRE